MFDADRPILHSADDRLNRAQFAKYLARCILDHKEPDSLVVGLYGGFGVGKTSLINMTLEELHFAASNMEDFEKPIILNFSPWSYSGQNELIYSFFRRLSSAIRSAEHLENADEIIYLLELYVSFFTHKPVPKALRSKRSLFNKLFSRKTNDIHGWESGRDLTNVKAELNALLSQQQQKIVIIIDNISRLYDQEIRQIFQIVKSMGDYANTAYLLAFDKEQVIQALDNTTHGEGARLLEKIVQLPFTIPPILAADLENILIYKLESVIHEVPIASWNKEHWAEIYYSSLKYFFENCRDITRYINILNFSYIRLRDIVNPCDFFALTALEVFTPDVYLGIRDNKDLFTDLLDNVYILNKEQASKDKARIEEILGRQHRIPREILLPLLLKLFPRLHHIYQANIPFYHSEAAARKDLRICSPDLFDGYFRLSMQSNQIEASEFDTLLALAKDSSSFDQALTRLNQDGRTLQFLNMLDSDRLQRIPRDHIQAIISALIDNGDLFPNTPDTLLSLSTPLRIHRILHTLLQRFGQSEERFHVLKKAIEHANKSIYIIVHELIQQSKEHDEHTSTYLPAEFRDLTSKELEDLKKLAVNRIKYWAEDDRLSAHPQLLAILFAWAEFSKDDSCSQFVKRMTKTDRGLVAFLMQALRKPINEVSTEYVLKPDWDNDLENISAFIAPQALEAHAKQIFEDPYFEKLPEKEQLALMIFLDLIRAKTNKVMPGVT